MTLTAFTHVFDAFFFTLAVLSSLGLKKMYRTLNNNIKRQEIVINKLDKHSPTWTGKCHLKHTSKLHARFGYVLGQLSSGSEKQCSEYVS